MKSFDKGCSESASGHAFMVARCGMLLSSRGVSAARARGVPDAAAVPIPSPITDHMALRVISSSAASAPTARFDSTNRLPARQFTAENDLGLTDQARSVNRRIMFRLKIATACG